MHKLSHGSVSKPINAASGTSAFHRWDHPLISVADALSFGLEANFHNCRRVPSDFSIHSSIPVTIQWWFVQKLVSCQRQSLKVSQVWSGEGFTPTHAHPLPCFLLEIRNTIQRKGKTILNPNSLIYSPRLGSRSFLARICRVSTYFVENLSDCSDHGPCLSSSICSLGVYWLSSAA